MADSHALRKVGLKATLPRIKVLEVLERSKTHHMGAEDVYKILLKEDEDIGLATVYRVLTQFETAGLIYRLNFEGGHSVYELNQGNHHDHILCVKCGKVDEFMDDVIEKRQRDIASKAGYILTDHSLNIYGVCGDCQKSDEPG